MEKIFSLASQGNGAGRITKQLIREKVPTPAWLNFTRYGTFAHIFEGKPESKRYEWTIAHVKAILKNEVYIGNSVHNKQSTVSFKSKKKVGKPESEWFRVENTHEPIIDKEVFYRVQEQIELEEQIASLREEIRKTEQEMMGAEKWIELIKENTVPKELTATLLNTMIEKILIHAPEINENGKQLQEVEIYYRFIGKIE